MSEHEAMTAPGCVEEKVLIVDTRKSTARGIWKSRD